MKEAFKHFTYNIFKRSNETPDKRKIGSEGVFTRKSFII